MGWWSAGVMECWSNGVMNSMGFYLKIIPAFHIY